jgi:hypothetical protein
MGHSVLQCAKMDYHTHTHTTHFGKPMGFPVPVANPITNVDVCVVSLPSGQQTLPHVLILAFIRYDVDNGTSN